MSDSEGSNYSEDNESERSFQGSERAEEEEEDEEEARSEAGSEAGSGIGVAEAEEVPEGAEVVSLSCSLKDCVLRV